MPPLPPDDDLALLSGPAFHNAAELGASIDDLQRAAIAATSRALLVLDVELPDATAPPDATDRADRLTARLGTELWRLFHDARHQLDPTLIAADVGSIREGGVLVLVMRADDDRRFAVRCNTFLNRYIDDHPQMAIRATLPLTLLDAASHLCSRPELDRPGDDSHRQEAILEQDLMLEQLQIRVLDGERSLAVIEAPRGRGKSALLGRLAARLTRRRHVFDVVATRRTSVESLERHWLAELDSTTAELPFLPVDEALAQGGETVLVDEAASLPLPTLEGLLARYRRVVFASTSAGHEAAGRAFAVRLPEIFDRERPAWKRFTPVRPMRWRLDDTLDRLLGDILASTAADHAGAPLQLDEGERAELGTNGTAREVNRDALAIDESQLRSIYGLLSATHYQSGLLDLANLIDAPAFRLWTIEWQARPVAAAVVVMESGVDPALHAAVLARRRRPAHCLLPVLLAQSADSGAALDADFARVLRLAVHPDVRRLGLGSRLLETIEDDLSENIEALGASFGENRATRAFWSANGFTPFHRGYRRNPRSGQHSLAVLRAHTARTRATLAKAADIHRDNAALVRAALMGRSDSKNLTQRHGRAPRVSTLSVIDAQLLTRFAQGERSLSDTVAALSRLIVLDGKHHSDVQAALVSGDDLTDLLELLGVSAPPERRIRLALLREWTAERLTLAQAILQR